MFLIFFFKEHELPKQGPWNPWKFGVVDIALSRPLRLAPGNCLPMGSWPPNDASRTASQSTSAPPSNSLSSEWDHLFTNS